MVEYLRSEKGYFYKIKKNGEKKRISREEYYKKNKKIIGGTVEIEEDDILYKNENICILKPYVKKGILVMAEFELKRTRKEEKSSCYEKFMKTITNNTIYFKAPYYSNIIDYTSIEKEIESSYGKLENDGKSRFFIRVDPDKTNVNLYLSALRNSMKKEDYEKKLEILNKRNKKKLSIYLKIIKDNKLIEDNVKHNEKIVWDSSTGIAKIYKKNFSMKELEEELEDLEEEKEEKEEEEGKEEENESDVVIQFHGNVMPNVPPNIYSEILVLKDVLLPKMIVKCNEVVKDDKTKNLNKLKKTRTFKQIQKEINRYLVSPRTRKQKPEKMDM
jgi:hypothetical protein